VAWKISFMMLAGVLAIAVWPVRAETLEERVAALESKAEEMSTSSSTFTVYWKDGLRLDSQDKSFKLKFGGRVMFDWNCFFNEDDDLPTFEDGLEFRRLWIYSSGTIYDNTEYKLQIDLTKGEGGSRLKDAYVGISDLLPFGNLRIGQFQEPFSLDEVISSNYETFMEQALPANTFSPSRSGGVMVYGTAVDERATWAAGVFRPLEDDNTASGSTGYAFTGRVTWSPWYEDEGEKAAHLGFACTYRDHEDDTVRFRQRPSLHMGEYVVNTDYIPSESDYRLGLEAALVLGPLAFQSEYIHTQVDREDAGSVSFGGAYAQASYFLTGEHRNLDTKKGSFGRTSPHNNYRRGGGIGAWQVAARYGWVDLKDGGVDGGTLNDITLGLNWYLNPNMRFMFNYVHAGVEDGNGGSYDGDVDGVGARFQVDF